MQAITAAYAVFTFVTGHWVEIGVAAGYVVAAARLIVAMTPTPADDTALAAAIVWLKKIGLHIED
jgi:hypothetical protein